MHDRYHLILRVGGWEGDEVELRGIMAHLGQISYEEPNRGLAADVASALLQKGYLPEMQSMQCHVLVVQGLEVDRYAEAMEHIKKASDTLLQLREASQPLVSLGLQIDARLEEFADHIATLEEIWREASPIAPRWHTEFCTPTIGEAQWLLNRMKGGKKKNEEAWRIVQYLGASPLYNVDGVLWAQDESPSAEGLLRDTTFKLLNVLNRARLPGEEGLSLPSLQNEKTMYEELEDGTPFNNTEPSAETKDSNTNQDTPRGEFADSPTTIFDDDTVIHYDVDSYSVSGGPGTSRMSAPPSAAGSRMTPINARLFGVKGNDVPGRASHDTVERLYSATSAGLPRSETVYNFFHEKSPFNSKIGHLASAKPTPIVIPDDEKIQEAPEWRDRLQELQADDARRKEKVKRERVTCGLLQPGGLGRRRVGASAMLRSFDRRGEFQSPTPFDRRKDQERDRL